VINGTLEINFGIVQEKLYYAIRETAHAPLSSRPYGALRDCERCALFIRGIEIASHLNERLMQQLLDGDLREYSMDKELWTDQVF
jgi:hypothetical protein